MIYSKKFIYGTDEPEDYTREVCAPYMRKNLVFDKLPDTATITLTALGFYKLYVNGREITRTHLAPYVTNPNEIILYDTYDIRDMLTVGRNTVAFHLGNGFQNNYGGFIWLFDKAPFLSSPRLAFAIEYECDGEKNVIEADESVLWYPSALVQNDLRVGVKYDARLECEGWNMPDFNDSGWAHASYTLPYGGEPVLSEATPIAVTKERSAVSIWREGDAFIYDFGTNYAGLTRLTISGTPGQTVTIHHGEVLIDGRFDQDNILFTHTNKKAIGKPAYTQRTVYILKGEGEESYTPDFTFYGFRYAKVEGITEQQATDKLLTYLEMSTDLKERGGFSSSDERLNRLEEMSKRATLSNFFHFPMDCPHREKNGWTGDAALSAEQTMLRFDPEKNYKTWLKQICASQNNAGALPGIVPTATWGFEWGNGPAWDRVLVELPYLIYKLRGDLEPARSSVSTMMKYFAYLRSRRDERGLLAIGLGDWLAPKNEYMPALAFTDSTVTYDMLIKAGKLFSALGLKLESEYANGFARELRCAIREHLFDKETMRFAGGEESAQAMAIYYGLCDGDEETDGVFSELLREIERRDGKMTVGILGHKALFRVLADHGYVDLALSMITREDGPSYGVMLREGYSCLSECITGKLQSLNHHVWSDISAFFLQSISGILPNPTADDLAHADIRPHFPASLDRARGYYTSPFGRIDTYWERRGEVIRLTVGFPSDMHGTLYLSDGYTFEDGTTERAIKPGTVTLIRR